MNQTTLASSPWKNGLATPVVLLATFRQRVGPAARTGVANRGRGGGGHNSGGTRRRRGSLRRVGSLRRRDKARRRSVTVIVTCPAIGMATVGVQTAAMSHCGHGNKQGCRCGWRSEMLVQRTLPTSFEVSVAYILQLSKRLLIPMPEGADDGSIGAAHKRKNRLPAVFT